MSSSLFLYKKGKKGSLKGEALSFSFVDFPPGFKLDEGDSLSLSEAFSYLLSPERKGMHIIKFGKASASINFSNGGSGSITIHSSDADDLIKLRDLAVLYIGGKVITAFPSEDCDIPSIGTIIRADFRRLCVWVKGLCQRIGMKMALQGS